MFTRCALRTSVQGLADKAGVLRCPLSSPSGLSATACECVLSLLARGAHLWVGQFRASGEMPDWLNGPLSMNGRRSRRRRALRPAGPPDCGSLDLPMWAPRRWGDAAPRRWCGWRGLLAAAVRAGVVRSYRWCRPGAASVVQAAPLDAAAHAGGWGLGFCACVSQSLR